LHGALLKNEQDIHLFERLVAMNRNHRWSYTASTKSCWFNSFLI
jgi:hypothetical protein